MLFNKNLIGVSGKIGSGKDTVAKIIQWLVVLDNEAPGHFGTNSLADTIHFIKYGKPFLETELFANSNYVIKKFADKLKDIICLLIGCTREDLEKEDFKNKHLGPEWDKFEFYRDRTYKPLRIYSTKEEAEKDLEIFGGGTVKTVKMTPRKLLQVLGTECGRNIIHENMWVNSTMKHYIARGANKDGILDTLLEDGTKTSYIPTLIFEGYLFPKWVITDVRFPSEAKAIKSRFGIIIRVNRMFSTTEYGGGIPATFSDTQFHPSETSLDNYNFDEIINNNGSLEDLILNVRAILIKHHIIVNHDN